MSESGSPGVLKLTTLPPELLHHIAWIYVSDMTSHNNVASVLSTCQLLRSLFLPKVYCSIFLFSLDQIASFLSPTSGSHKYCSLYTTDSVVINIPGVPGGGDGTLTSSSEHGRQRSRDRLLLTARVLAECPQAEHISLEFFSIRHSEVLTSEAFRRQEAEEFGKALSKMKCLKTIRWIPPRREPSAIMGLSIVVVDQVIESLARGLAGCTQLRSLELWNTMLPASGGLVLADTLVDLVTARDDEEGDASPTLSLNLRSVTGLDPRTVSVIAMSSPNVRVNIADGFIGSIWGPRIDHDAITDSSIDLVKSVWAERSPSSTADDHSRIDQQLEAVLRRISSNVTIKVLKGGIAGSRYASA